MRQILRFSVSGVLGFFITAALFVGMLSLLKDHKTPTDTQDLNINFSFVKDYQKPKVEQPKKFEKPVPKKVSQPPKMTNNTIKNPDPPLVGLPENTIKGKNINLLSHIKLPGTSGHSGPAADSPGTIKAAIAPMYPQSALVSKTEGWVQLKINIDQFGSVSSASVIDAKPVRVFNTAAIKAVKKWKFHPKTIDGKAVPFQAVQTIEFKLDQ